MEHLLILILWGELGVILLLSVNLYKRWKSQAIQKSDIKAFYVEHIIYFIVCAVVIYVLNNSGASAAAKELFGLKPGNLTELYCFSSIGLSSASITKSILGAAL